MHLSITFNFVTFIVKFAKLYQKMFHLSICNFLYRDNSISNRGWVKKLLTYNTAANILSPLVDNSPLTSDLLDTSS